MRQENDAHPQWRSDLEQLIQQFKANRDYAEAERALRAIIPAVTNTDQHAVSEFRESLDNETAAVLFELAERFTTAALRTKDHNALVTAVATLLLEGGSVEPRESLIRLAAAYDAGQRCGASVIEMAQHPPLNVFSPLPAFFSDFAAGAPWQRSLKSMGLEVVAGEGGLDYQMIKPPWER